MKIPVGVSNRHIHLTQADADILFGKDYQFQKKADLRQPGQYACEEVVKISTDKYTFPHVRLILPIRNYTQVEISTDDSILLGINPPVRDSGDLANSCSVTITGPKGKIEKENCCIKANRHIHCNKSDNIGFKNGDIVSVHFNGQTINDVHIKMNDNYKLEMHIDRNDQKEFNLNTGDYVDLD